MGVQHAYAQLSNFLLNVFLHDMQICLMSSHVVGSLLDNTLPSPPVRLDPVRCFAGYASHVKPFDNQSSLGTELPNVLFKARQPFCDQLSRSLPENSVFDWGQLMQRKQA